MWFDLSNVQKCESPLWFHLQRLVPSASVFKLLYISAWLFVWMDAKQLMCVQVMIPDLTLGCGVKCHLSMKQSAFLYYFTDSLNLFIYFYCSSPPQRAPIKKKKKKPSIHQGNFSCGAPDTCSIYTNYFLFLMDWTWAFIHFSKCPCRQHALCILHLPCEWSPASVLVNSPHWLASGVWTLRMIKSIEGQPDGQHQLTSCSNQPPHWGPVSSFQRGRGSLWYCVDYDWQTQCFGLSPSEMPSSRVHCNSQGQGWGLYVSPDN